MIRVSRAKHSTQNKGGKSRGREGRFLSKPSRAELIFERLISPEADKCYGT